MTTTTGHQDLAAPPHHQVPAIDTTLPAHLPEAHAMILALRRELADLDEIAHRHAELYTAKLHALRTELEQARGGTLPLQ